MRRGVIRGGAVAAAAFAGVFVAGPRVGVEVDSSPAPVPPIGEVVQWLAASEASVVGLRPGAEKTVVWADPDAPSVTPLSVVYLHGYSATRRESEPLADSVAAALGANLFYTRLTGHGLDGEALADATAGDWLRDAAEAVAVGRRLGERVVLMGTSTGATLALWAAARLDEADAVAAVVALSPNFRPADPAAGILLWPWGGSIARAVVGPTRSWEPANEAQGRWWTTVYPTRALLPMMALVDLVDDAVLADVRAPTLVVYAPGDRVVDVDAIRTRSRHLAGAEVVAWDGPVGDPGVHVLAGDILSPGSTAPLSRRIATFLRSPPP